MARSNHAMLSIHSNKRSYNYHNRRTMSDLVNAQILWFRQFPICIKRFLLEEKVNLVSTRQKVVIRMPALLLGCEYRDILHVEGIQ